MTDFGLRVYTWSYYPGSMALVNIPSFDSTAVTYNHVASFIAPANETTTKLLPEIEGKEVQVYQSLIAPDIYARKATVHDVNITGQTLTMSGGAEDVYAIVLAKG